MFKNFLNQCLLSVKNQDFDSYEVILIDDGSTDESGAIADSYSDEQKFKVIHTENRGVSHARNVGMKLARGQYLTFVDSDDYIKPNYLSELHKEIQQSEADLVECGWFLCSETGEMMSECGFLKNEEYNDGEILQLIQQMSSYSIEEMKQWLKTRSYKRGSPIAAKMFRKSVLERNSISFDETLKVGEDMIFNMTVYLNSKKVIRCSYSGYYYRQRNNSALGSYSTTNNAYLLDNKKQLAIMRDKVCQKIEDPCKRERVKESYFGSLILSCGQIAVILSSNKGYSLIEKKRLYNSYSKLNPVIEARNKFTLNDLTFKYFIALFLIKYNLSSTLLLSLSIMNALGHEIKL